MLIFTKKWQLSFICWLLNWFAKTKHWRRSQFKQALGPVHVVQLPPTLNMQSNKVSLKFMEVWLQLQHHSTLKAWAFQLMRQNKVYGKRVDKVTAVWRVFVLSQTNKAMYVCWLWGYNSLSSVLHRRLDSWGAVLSHQEGEGAWRGRRLQHHTLQWRDALLWISGRH